MISILAQERLIGAALGCAFTASVVIYQRTTIQNSVSQFSPQPQYVCDADVSVSENVAQECKLLFIDQMKEPVLHKRSNLDFAHVWNRAVDQTFGPAIESLSSRGW